MRLTWPFVALVLGILAACVAVLRTVADAASDVRRISLGLYAIDRGGMLDPDGNVYMPGDAEDFPDEEG